MIKRITMVAAALAACVSLAAADGASKSNLAEARAKITQAIENPAVMTEVMKSLSKEDQVSFLAEVNAAIAAMPGDAADRTAKFVNVNNAALAGTQKGNALTLIAEVFATVPPYALVAVGENLSAGLMNRAADKSVTYTDEQYARISQTVMAKVNERVASENDSGVRSAIAGLMLINASNSATPEIVNAVVTALPESIREDAKTEWYPAAMASGSAKSYDPILAAAEGDDYEIAKQTSGALEGLVPLRASALQTYDAILVDIVSSSSDPSLAPAGRNPVTDAIQDPFNRDLPNEIGDPANNTAQIINQVQRWIDEERLKEHDEGGDYPYSRR